MTIRDGVIVGRGIDEAAVESIPDDAPRAEALQRLMEAGMRQPSDRFDEIYLQLFLLDIDDEESIERWINEFDYFSIHARGTPFRPGSDHPYPFLESYPMFDAADDVEHIDPECRWFPKVLEEESHATRMAACFGDDLDNPSVILKPTVEEFQWAVRCLRDLARTYWCLSTGSDGAELAWDNPLIELSYATKDGNWWDQWAMEEFLSDTLKVALAGFSPRLIEDELKKLQGPDRVSELSEQFAASLDLFTICCLELFNHIAERAVYKSCANLSCGRWFVRQAGRSAHDQRRRTGVKFCSHRCARAHTQRAYRERQRAA